MWVSIRESVQSSSRMFLQSPQPIPAVRQPWATYSTLSGAETAVCIV